MQNADKFQITDGGVHVRQFDFSWELNTSLRHMLAELTARLSSFSDPPQHPHPSQRTLKLDDGAAGTTPTALTFILNSLPFNVLKDSFA